MQGTVYKIYTIYTIYAVYAMHVCIQYNIQQYNILYNNVYNIIYNNTIYYYIIMYAGQGIGWPQRLQSSRGCVRVGL